MSMAVIMLNNPLELALMLSICAISVSMIVLAIARITCAGHRRGGYSEDMYLGGESSSSLRIRIPSVTAMYWGLISRAFKRTFSALRDKVHSGILNEWFYYMSIWFFLLTVIAIITIVVCTRW